MEDNETVRIDLSNPVNAFLISPFTYELLIIDNDGGVNFDGLRWFHSEDISYLTVNTYDHLVWTAEKGDQIIVRLPEQRLSQTGDVAEFTYLWKSNGTTFYCDCGDRNCTEPGATCCFDDDVTCTAGTGDFRMGLFDSNGRGYVDSDGTGSDDPVFNGYLGYQFRTSPHVSSSARPFNDSTGEFHTPGRLSKRTDISSTSLLGRNDTYATLRDIGGFNLPLDVFSVINMRLERTSSSRVKLTFTLNGISYSTTDSSSSRQPDKIDVFAAHFPNARPYYDVTLAVP
jgi:hypothetical protein